MKTDWKKLIVCVGIPLITGGVSALLTGGGMKLFERVNKPPAAPPGWVFPVVWTALFILMGVASYLVLTSDKPRRRVHRALFLYAVQLAVNFFWPVFFFGLKLFLFSFIWLALLWVLIAATLSVFFTVSRTAGYLLIPYLLWVSFAGYLNLSIYLLN